MRLDNNKGVSGEFSNSLSATDTLLRQNKKETLDLDSTSGKTDLTDRYRTFGKTAAEHTFLDAHGTFFRLDPSSKQVLTNLIDCSHTSYRF